MIQKYAPKNNSPARRKKLNLRGIYNPFAISLWKNGLLPGRKIPRNFRGIFLKETYFEFQGFGTMPAEFLLARHFINMI